MFFWVKMFSKLPFPGIFDSIFNMANKHSMKVIGKHVFVKTIFALCVQSELQSLVKPPWCLDSILTTMAINQGDGASAYFQFMRNIKGWQDG